MHIELDMINFKFAFNKVLVMWGRNIPGFEDGRKMIFLATRGISEEQ